MPVRLTLGACPLDPNRVSEESEELDVLTFSSGTTSSCLCWDSVPSVELNKPAPADVSCVVDDSCV